MALPVVTDQRFAGITVEGYFRAGTPAAAEHLHGDLVSCVRCVRCGAKIGHVFATSHGPMGGDCLATLTGDESSRRINRQLTQKLSTWAANPDLYGFRVESTSDVGVVIRGLYRRDGRTWPYLLWAGGRAPAAMVHGIVQQFVQQFERHGRELRFAAGAA